MQHAEGQARRRSQQRAAQSEDHKREMAAVKDEYERKMEEAQKVHGLKEYALRASLSNMNSAYERVANGFRH